ncbi:MAG: sugar ABC transporter permease [Candidatus Caldatribacterium sp.]|nr:sugar ABC transporter permease [Candidatus Caldatribacterium sp.]
MLLFLIFPLFSGVIMSLQETTFAGDVTFVGLKNFRLLFREARFLNNLKLSLIYVLGNLSFSIPLAYIASLIITSQDMRGLPILRGVFLLPFITAPVVSSVIFLSLTDASNGPITLLIEKLTGERPVILATPSLAMWTIIFHSFWRSFPFIMLFLAAGMTAIPNELYEAAKVDGATPWHLFRFITFPLTRIHLALSMLIITMWTVQDAETVFALTRGGPGYSTEVLAVRLFKDSFINFNLNLGATVGVILLGISLLFMVAYLRLMRER